MSAGLPGMGDRFRVAEHVVHRAIGGEIVALNLETGQYHGFNAVGGRVLELIGDGSDLAAVASTIAEEYGVELDRVQQDVAELCQALLERGLVTSDAG